MSAQFRADTKAALLRAGWRLAEAPSGLTLAGLRATGAPFKGSKYFDQQAAHTVKAPPRGGEVAYRPGLLPESLNQPFERAVALLAHLERALPPGATATIGPAALYVWLLWERYRASGEWLLSQRYTWAADRSGSTHLAVGVFGRERPLLVSPIPEGMGRGLGVLPLVLPLERETADERD